VAIIPNENPQPTSSHLVHPREYEYQATYRGYLFGPFRFFRGEQSMGELMQRRNKARLILKWFLLNPGKLGSADEFIDLFWPEISPKQALGNFHVTMHYLRRILEPGLNARAASTFIHRKPNNFYWFQLDENWWIDTSDLKMLLERAHDSDRREDYSRTTYYYRKIAGYCSQGFLPEDESEDWLLPYRRHYKHIYYHVLKRLIQIYTQRNELEEVLEYAYQTLLIDPFNEIATRAIVDTYLRQENISGAQHRLDAFLSSLQQGLGLRPSKDLFMLRERIRAASNSTNEN
jgi:DNA-binding SARP family transcriptional activator